MVNVTTFERDSEVKVTEAGECVAEVTDNWSVNGVPNGGYLMAIMQNGLSQHTEREAPVLFTANYLGRTSVGPATVEAEQMVQSKQFDRMQVSLKQGEKETVRAMVTLMDKYDEDAEVRCESKAPDLLPRKSCQRVMPMPGYSIFSNTVALLEPETFGWMSGELTEKSQVRGWFRLKDEMPWTEQSILFAADAFLPPILTSQGVVAWVPTIEISVQIRRIPTTRWLKGVFRSKYVTSGLVEEDGEIWDEEGNLVAIVRQLAQFRRAPSSKIQKVQNAGLKVLHTAQSASRRRRERK